MHSINPRAIEEEKRRLRELIQGKEAPQKIVLRGNIVLGMLEGMSKKAIAEKLDISRPTVYLWIDRYSKGGIQALVTDVSRPGRTPTLRKGTEESVIDATLHTLPPNGVRWSVRTMARELGLSRMAVQRIWKKHNIDPACIETSKGFARMEDTDVIRIGTMECQEVLGTELCKGSNSGLMPNGQTEPVKNRLDDMLITTKLRMPPVKSTMLPRKHLIDRLSAGKDRRLIVISGIAASGKTSLVSQWINDNNLSAAWYSIDKTDNESDLFFRYLVAALARSDNNLAISIRSWLNEPRQFTAGETIPFLIEVFSDHPGDIYLVLDDYHLIHSKAIHDALSYLLDYIPPKLHVVMLSRYAVPILLGHFRVRNQIVEITASDMQFTEEETTRFFTEIMPLQISTDDIKDLARYTEGWAGGLQLFALSLKDKRTLHDLDNILNRACQETTDFLIDEVVQAQPEKIQTFLRATALLDRFNANLCREVTGFNDAAEILDYLYRKSFFLIPLDAEHMWFRYHHLLSEAIRKMVKNSFPAIYGDIQRKAAFWFAIRGYAEDAFRHAFSSEDLEFAADLLEDYLLFVPDHSGYGAGMRWIAKVPHHILNKRVLLRLHDCGQKVESFKLAEVEETLRDIEAHLPKAMRCYKGEKRTLCQDLFTFFTYMIRYYYKDPKGADVDRLGEAYHMISRQNKQFAGYIKIFIALSCLVQGNPRDAAEALKDASAAIFSTESIWARILWYRLSAVVEGFQGNLNRSEAICQEALDMLEYRGMSYTPLRFPLYLPKAWNSYYRNDLAAAKEYASSAIAYCERTRLARDVMEGGLLLSLVCLTGGDMDGMESSMKKVRQAVKELDVDLGLSVDVWSARLSMLRGNLREACRWADQRKVSIKEPFSMCLARECTIQAEIWFRQGLYHETARMLEGLRTLCSDRNLMIVVLDIDLLYSATLYALNDHEGAKTTMEQALRFAETEGYVRPFVNYSLYISPLLLEMAKDCGRGRESSFLFTLMECCGITVGHTGASKRGLRPVAIGGLTNREVEILTLMAMGCRNKEIANKTFVSPNTIKTHIQHIFEKLHVTTRAQAIRSFLDFKSAR